MEPVGQDPAFQDLTDGVGLLGYLPDRVCHGGDTLVIDPYSGFPDDPFQCEHDLLVLPILGDGDAFLIPRRTCVFVFARQVPQVFHLEIRLGLVGVTLLIGGQ